MKKLLTFLACIFFTHAAEKPNIIYILADDLGYADVGFNGGKIIQTPHLDRLAKAGTILSSFYVQPLCSPTRASFLSGRYVTHHSVYTVVRPNVPWGLPLEERTLPQALKEAGYVTAISGKWHLGESAPTYLPTQRGFDHQYGLWTGNLNYFTLERDGKRDWYRDDKPCGDQGYSTELIGQEASRLIRENDPNKPLFLYLAFNAPHSPYQVPDSYKKPYAHLSPSQQTYAGMITAMDSAIGQVVAALEEKKLLANTLILFSSDNGGVLQHGSNGPLRDGKGSVFEGGMRVCSFATWPGKIPAGKTVTHPCHIIDWYPTLLQLTGGSLTQKLPLDGKNLWPMLTQGAPSPHDAILLHGTTPGKVAVRAGDWKFIKGATTADHQLYHLTDDLGEKNNLATKNPEKRTEMLNHLERLLKNAVPFPEHSYLGKEKTNPSAPKKKQKKDKPEATE